ALGSTYTASGEHEKAANIFRNFYFTMTLSAEASQADEELKKLAGSSPLPPASLNMRSTRADLLAKGKRFSDAAEEYRALVDQVSPPERAELQLTLAVALRRSGQTKEAKKVLDAISTSTPEMNAQRLF